MQAFHVNRSAMAEENGNIDFIVEAELAVKKLPGDKLQLYYYENKKWKQL